MAIMRRRAIFLDKDGTLIPDIPYNADPDKISWYSDVPGNLIRLSDAGFKLIVVTNQPGVAKGFFHEAKINSVKAKMAEMFSDAGVELLDFYYCPHHPDGIISEFAKICSCRKPMPGLLLKAAVQHSIDLDSSWMVGDILNDVECGNRAGCKTVLINNGNETEWVKGKYRSPDYITDSFQKAVDSILSMEESEECHGNKKRILQ